VTQSVTPPQSVPLIYGGSVLPAKAQVHERCIAAGLAILCLIPLVIAAILHPSPDGFATHTQLHMQPCQFLEHFGVPCPGCGMTTSWAWFVRGNLVAAIYVQPMGTLLAFLAMATVWVGAYVAVTGRPVYRLLNRFDGRYYFIGLLGFGIAAWCWKILIHQLGHDGW
jgi:hypothetical protein